MRPSPIRVRVVGQAADASPRRYSLAERYREGLDALRRFREAVKTDPPEAVRQNRSLWTTIQNVVGTVRTLERQAMGAWERGDREEAVRLLDQAVPRVESLSRRIEAQRGALATWWRSPGVREAREELVRFAQEYVLEAPRRIARAVDEVADEAGETASSVGKAVLIGGAVVLTLLVVSAVRK